MDWFLYGRDPHHERVKSVGGPELPMQDKVIKVFEKKTIINKWFYVGLPKLYYFYVSLKVGK